MLRYLWNKTIAIRATDVAASKSHWPHGRIGDWWDVTRVRVTRDYAFYAMLWAPLELRSPMVMLMLMVMHGLHRARFVKAD